METTIQETGSPVFLSSSDRRLEDKLMNMIVSVLKPVSCYDGKTGSWRNENLYCQWSAFRSFCLSVKGMHRTDEFMSALGMMNEIIEDMFRDRLVPEQCYDEAALDCFLYSKNIRELYEGTLLLIEMLDMIPVSEDHDDPNSISREEKEDLLISLKVISECQRIWMNREDKK